MCRARWASEDPNFQNSLRWTNFRAPCLIFMPGNPAYKWFSKAGKVFHGFDWIAAQGTLWRGKTASQRMEEGKGQTWSEQSMSATNCVHMQHELVNTRPTWQMYKDWILITCSWNISLKWWFKWLWFKIRLFKNFLNISNTIYWKPNAASWWLCSAPTEVLYFWMLPQKVIFKKKKKAIFSPLFALQQFKQLGAGAHFISDLKYTLGN